MSDREVLEPIERLRGLGEEIDRAISEARLRRAQIEGEHRPDDEVRELRRLLREQSRRRRDK